MTDTVPKSASKRPQPRGGSRAGIPNRATSDARQAIALFVDDNADKLHGWLNAVADGDPENDVKPNPAKAFELFQSVVEYHIPKLARTELRGPNDDGSHTFTVNAPWLKQSIQKRNT